MGSLNKVEGSGVNRKIKLFDVTGMTASQIESFYNTQAGLSGWRVVQAIVIGTKTYIIAEKEL